MKNNAYISLGSNLGNRKLHISQAIELISNFGSVVHESPLYTSEPWGYESAESFINGVVLLKTELNPSVLLSGLLDIERTMGRERSTDGNYADRIIDLDILFFNSEIIKSGELEVPHPRLQFRNFILYPMNDIASDFVHPVLGHSIEYLKSNSTDGDIPVQI